jgi:hypothetical protein
VARHPILVLWAVPRSASTAFERMMIERGDHDVVDEPFSAHYYFGEDKVSDRFDTVEPCSSPEEILASLEDRAGGAPVFVKDMAYHAARIATGELVRRFRNAFLIREPSAAISSLAAKWPDFTDEEGGFDGLATMVDLVEREGQELVVIDHADLCREPGGVVRAYCDRMDIPFDHRALSWSAGMRPEWARWADWHAASAASTGFHEAPARRTGGETARVRAVAERAVPVYEALYERRLRPVSSG